MGIDNWKQYKTKLKACKEVFCAVGKNTKADRQVFVSALNKARVKEGKKLYLHGPQFQIIFSDREENRQGNGNEENSSENEDNNNERSDSI